MAVFFLWLTFSGRRGIHESLETRRRDHPGSISKNKTKKIYPEIRNSSDQMLTSGPQSRIQHHHELPNNPTSQAAQATNAADLEFCSPDPATSHRIYTLQPRAHKHSSCPRELVSTSGGIAASWPRVARRVGFHRLAISRPGLLCFQIPGNETARRVVCRRAGFFLFGQLFEGLGPFSLDVLLGLVEASTRSFLT